MSTIISLPVSGNPVWITVFSAPQAVLLHAYLLGLGPEDSLLCGLPKEASVEPLAVGQACKGRFFFDGDVFDFESTVQDLVCNPFAIRLAAPTNISKQAPRSLPRLSVNLPGTVRPLRDNGAIVAVLPMTLIDLSPTGCQFRMVGSAWPTISALKVQLSCRLPDLHHFSRIHGFIEWVHPREQITMGIRFVFRPGHDTSQQDLRQWFTSQKARLINITA